MPKRNADQNPPATQLNARGLSLRDHYRHEFPKWMQKLRAKREEEQFFLDLQRRYEDTEARLAEQDLPPGDPERDVLPGR